MKIIIDQPQIIWELGTRENQEDSVFPACGESTSEDKIFILCDGMGGHERGEVASSTVCSVLSSYFHDNWDGIGFTDGLLFDALSRAMDELKKNVTDKLRNPGTTLTLLVFHKGGAFVAHIGDSRIYHIRPSEHRLLYKSRDHSQVYDLLAAGDISLEEMNTYSKKNVITRAMIAGADRVPKPSIAHVADIRPGDYFYLCSDGMLEEMSDSELVDIFSKDISDDAKRDLLVESTKENNDNHSAYIIHIKDVIPEDDDIFLKNDEAESPTNALLLENEAKNQPVNKKTGFFTKMIKKIFN